MDIIINNKLFKQFRNTVYYSSIDGEIYSKFVNRLIKPIIRIANNKAMQYIDIYNQELKRQQHIAVHKIVYVSWISEIPEGLQINHKNDNALDNRLENLYVGTQSENVQDCINNGHRVGSVFVITIYDNFTDEILTFAPAHEMFKYIGHDQVNGGISRCFNRQWFDIRYTVLEYKRINNLAEYNLYK